MLVEHGAQREGSLSITCNHGACDQRQDQHFQQAKHDLSREACTGQAHRSLCTFHYESQYAFSAPDNLLRRTSTCVPQLSVTQQEQASFLLCMQSNLRVDATHRAVLVLMCNICLWRIQLEQHSRASKQCKAQFGVIGKCMDPALPAELVGNVGMFALHKHSQLRSVTLAQVPSPIRSMDLVEGLPNLIKLPSSIPSKTPKIVADSNGSCMIMPVVFLWIDRFTAGGNDSWCC